MQKETLHRNKVSIKNFLSKCNQICSFMQVWSHFAEESLMENFNFCAGKIFVIQTTRTT